MQPVVQLLMEEVLKTKVRRQPFSSASTLEERQKAMRERQEFIEKAAAVPIRYPRLSFNSYEGST